MPFIDSLGKQDRIRRLNAQFPLHVRERLNGPLQISGGMRRRDLGADARLPLRHDRIREADDVDALRKHRVGELRGKRRIFEHYRADGMRGWFSTERS